MAKRAVAKKLSAAEEDLRRWCIEQAIRWPWDAGRPGSYGAMGGQIPIQATPASQPNILVRATEILTWVRGSN